MTDQGERLKQLAEMASSEQDLQKFMAFAREINLILEEKQERLARLRIPSKPSEYFRLARHHLNLPCFFPRESTMEQSFGSMTPKLGAGDKTMPLPEEVHRRLAARAVTDPDVASLLAIFTKTNETVSEPPLDHVIENAETPKLLGEPVDLLYYTLRSKDQRTDCGYDAGRNPAALSESLGLLDCQTFRLNY